MKKKLLISLVVLALLLAALPLAVFAKSQDTTYSDISNGWYTDAIVKYGYSEIFKDNGSKFNPNKKITRIEFVRLLHKALGISINYFVAPDVSKDFDDMKNSDVGANDLIDLATAGIVERGGSFNPDNQLDRDLMIHWILNALKYETNGTYPIPMVKPVPFKDDDKITADYRGEIYSSVVLKLIYGRGNNMLFPKDGATRAEAVTIVSRLMVLLESANKKVDVTPSAAFDKDGKLTMSLVIQNNTDKAVTINHTSGMKYDFKLFDAAGTNIYTWSADKMFMALVNSTVLQPGEKIEFSDTIDSTVCPALSAAVTMTAYIIGTSSDFTIDTNGYTAAIVK